MKCLYQEQNRCKIYQCSLLIYIKIFIYRRQFILEIFIKKFVEFIAKLLYSDLFADSLNIKDVICAKQNIGHKISVILPMFIVVLSVVVTKYYVRLL